MKQNKHNHGFKVPETYFLDFEARLLDKLEEEKLPKATGFKTPEGYFEALEESVIKRLDLPEKKGKVIPLFSRKVWGYTASIAACAALVFFFFNINKTQPDNFDTVQFSAISNYIEGENLGLDISEIESLLNEDEINTIQFEYDVVSEDVMEEYLLDNLDVSTLLNQ